MGNLNKAVLVAAFVAGGVGVGTLSRASNGVLGQFQELSATFDAGTGALVISAVNETDLQSMGFVRELGGAGRTALFGPGFVAEPNPASFDALLTVSNIGENSAEVTGQITITDVDGDTMSIGVDHQLVMFGPGDADVIGFTWWVGIQCDEGYFDGTDGGQVSTDFPLTSALLSLFVVRDPRDGEGLFHSSFIDGRGSTVFAIPAPISVLPLVGGAMIAGRRRRVA